MKYYLSLGSNIKAEENIAFAIDELKKILTVYRKESIEEKFEIEMKELGYL